jgi:diguanylate cyclase (GGDEF)-like protein
MMWIIRIARFFSRHRATVRDLTLVTVFAALGVTLAYWVDIFPNEGGAGPRLRTVELDEALLVGGLTLLTGLLLFISRYSAQKQEMRRRIAAEAEVRKLAFQDALTGLPNRRQFDDALKAALASPPRSPGMHGVFLLDLNGFKRINDICGHAVGDEVLVIVAQRLFGAMREGDLIARLGGDEFAILAMNLMGPEAATNLARRVIQALDAPVMTGKKEHAVAVAIGVAFVPNDATTHDEILRKADVALYRAKAERRSALRFFEVQMDHHIHEHDAVARELRAALAANALDIVYQPSIDLGSGEVVAFEVLPRWTHCELGEIPPERFIPIAEEAGMIHELAESLLRRACVTASRWPAHVRLAMDLFPGQLQDSQLTTAILKVLAEYGIAPGRVELEVTESALVRDLRAAEATLSALCAAGVRITLDNFGTGYSTLYHLRACKLDKIKIDPAFVTGMSSEREKARLVSALVGLGQGLGLTIAADGIVTAGQGALLALSGCQQGQGQWISGPVSASETTLLFQNPFPHMPRSMERPGIPQPFLQAVEDHPGADRVDESVL